MVTRIMVLTLISFIPTLRGRGARTRTMPGTGHKHKGNNGMENKGTSNKRKSNYTGALEVLSTGDV